MCLVEQQLRALSEFLRSAPTPGGRSRDASLASDARDVWIQCDYNIGASRDGKIGLEVIQLGAIGGKTY